MGHYQVPGEGFYRHHKHRLQDRIQEQPCSLWINIQREGRGCSMEREEKKRMGSIQVFSGKLTEK